MKRIIAIFVAVAAAVLMAGLLPGYALQRPQLKLCGTKLVEGRTYYELEMSNPYDQPLSYLGYVPEDPRLEREFWEGGTWNEPGGYRCGFGLMPQTIPAHASRRFEVYPAEDRPFRVGLDLYRSERQEPNIIRLSWLPVEASEWFERWQSDRIYRKWRQGLLWSQRLEPVANPPWQETTTEIVPPPPANPQDAPLPPAIDPFAGPT